MKEHVGAEVLAEGKYLRLVRVGKWEFAQRPIAGAVILLAVTSDECVLLVEQYRLPVQASVIEFPAGLVGDEPGMESEPMEIAAHRELLEETGYEAQSLRKLFTGCASAGMTDETATFFLASGLRRVGQGGGVAGEKITLHEVPLAEAHRWLERRMQEGAMVDGRVYSGLYWILHSRGQIGG